MSTRKQVVAALATVEKQLHDHQTNAHKYKGHLLAWVHENTPTFTVLLFASFFVGWHYGKKLRMSSMVKHAGKLLPYLPNIGFLVL